MGFLSHGHPASSSRPNATRPRADPPARWFSIHHHRPRNATTTAAGAALPEPPSQLPMPSGHRQQPQHHTSPPPCFSSVSPMLPPNAHAPQVDAMPIVAGHDRLLRPAIAIALHLLRPAITAIATTSAPQLDAHAVVPCFRRHARCPCRPTSCHPSSHQTPPALPPLITAGQGMANHSPSSPDAAASFAQCPFRRHLPHLRMSSPSPPSHRRLTFCLLSAASGHSLPPSPQLVPPLQSITVASVMPAPPHMLFIHGTSQPQHHLHRLSAALPVTVRCHAPASMLHLHESVASPHPSICASTDQHSTARIFYTRNQKSTRSGVPLH